MFSAPVYLEGGVGTANLWVGMTGNDVTVNIKVELHIYVATVNNYFKLVHLYIGRLIQILP